MVGNSSWSKLISFLLLKLFYSAINVNSLYVFVMKSAPPQKMEYQNVLLLFSRRLKSNLYEWKKKKNKKHYSY